MDLALTLEFNNPLNPECEMPVALQKRLMAPFGVLKRINSLGISGLHSKQLISDLRTAIATPDPTPEECLELATKLKDAGNAELDNRKPKEAIQYYIQAFHAIHVVNIGRYRSVWADAWFDRVLHGGRFHLQHGQYIRIILRVHLVAQVIGAFLSMEDYDEAYFWGNRTMNIIRQATSNENDVPMPTFPAARDLGRVLFGTGVAARALGKTAEALRLVTSAHGYLPRDEEIKKELVSMTTQLCTVEG
jgi:hypothetical protein